VIKVEGRTHFENVEFINLYFRAIEHTERQDKDIGKAMIRGNSILMWECMDKIVQPLY
jgi:hypothetical protein